MSVMPRYWTGSGINDTSSPDSSAEYEGAARGRHGPAQVHRDLGVLDLPAAARAVVVGVDALGRLRAIVLHGAPELADILHHHPHPVRVTLAEEAARGVVGPRAAELEHPPRA